MDPMGVEILFIQVASFATNWTSCEMSNVSGGRSLQTFSQLANMDTTNI